ncbi:MAG: RNA polymerase sigma factor [Sandaracinaceae bacterium]|jgi:RNA polymerase sigma-70 factor (ECF subfamily)|nr:RNA polymerase sigma factor [Sandaracinaceae bacterium]
MEPPSRESALFERWLDGDERAFREIFELLGPTVVAIARRHGLGDAEAKDVVQQTFLGVHRARDDFRRGAPVRPWVVTIARNVVRDQLRRRYVRREDALELDGPIEPRVEAPEYGVPSAEALLTWAHKALAKLPEAQRRVIELHYVEGRSFADVAREVGCSEGAARVRAHRGYETIRGWLADPQSAGLDDPFG